MPLEAQNFEVWQGRDKSPTVTVYANDTTTLVDITNYDITWSLMPHPQSTAATITKSSTSATQIKISTSSTGVFTIYLNSTDTAALNAQVYYHEAKGVDASTEETTLLHGYATVHASGII